MDRQRHLGLSYEPAPSIGDCRRVVVPLLDVGREGSLLNGNPALVVDRLKAAPDDLQRDGIKVSWLRHGSIPITMFPSASMRSRLLGGTSVVASNCVITRGPSSVVPGTSALRSMKGATTGLSALNQTGC